MKLGCHQQEMLRRDMGMRLQAMERGPGSSWDVISSLLMVEPRRKQNPLQM